MSSKPPVKGGAWTRVAIFIALYTLLLESLIEWVLVIYLYATQRVDSKMMPSVILALAASFCTVPLVVLHSLTAWQYNKVAGLATQKIVLHTCCIYLLRLSVAAWLACCVAGLVVVAQHASCLPGGTKPTSFWNAGFSCELQRTVFIVSIVSFLTICVFFCSRELCDRPYDVSILGVYKPQPPNRDESILSNTSWDSECTLKNDVVCLCRHPDGASGHYCQWAGDVHTCKSVKHPAPKRPKPALTIITRPEPDGPTSPSFLEDMSSQVSWTPTVTTSPTVCPPQISASPAELPTIQTSPKGHKRAKSSLSSLKKRLIPKVSQPFLPLSADPQIRALSDPSEHEKQMDILSRAQAQHQLEKPSSTTPDIKPRNSSDAPEVVLQEQIAPLKRKTNRAYTSNIPLPPALSINHPQHPNYVPPYPRPPSRTQNLTPTHTQPQSRNMPSAALNYYSNPEKQMPKQGPTPRPQAPPPRNPNPSFRRSQTNPSYPGGVGRGPSSQIQRTSLSLSQGHGQAQNRSQGQSQNFYAINRTASALSRQQSQPHRASTQHIYRNSSYNDVEIIYPSTRRSRSSTGYTNVNCPVRLDSITEVPVPASEDDRFADAEQPERRRTESVDGSVYRGADRTSLCNGI